MEVEESARNPASSHLTNPRPPQNLRRLTFPLCIYIISEGTKTTSKVEEEAEKVEAVASRKKKTGKQGGKEKPDFDTFLLFSHPHNSFSLLSRRACLSLSLPLTLDSHALPLPFMRSSRVAVSNWPSAVYLVLFRSPSLKRRSTDRRPSSTSSFIAIDSRFPLSFPLCRARALIHPMKHR